MRRYRRNQLWHQRLIFLARHGISLKAWIYLTLFCVGILLTPGFFVSNEEDSTLHHSKLPQQPQKQTETIVRPTYDGPPELVLKSQYLKGESLDNILKNSGHVIHKRSVEDEDGGIIDSSDNGEIFADNIQLLRQKRAVLTAQLGSGQNSGDGSGESSGSGDTTTELPTTIEPTTPTIESTTPTIEPTTPTDGNTISEGSGSSSTESSSTEEAETAVTCPITNCPVATPCPTLPPLEATGIAIWVYIIIVVAGVAGIFFGMLCCYMRNNRRQRHLITPITSPYSSHDKLRDIEEAKELDDYTAAVISREEMINRSLAMGSVIVLEFSINEARSSNLHKENHELISRAESKLYEWKRTQSGLVVAHQYNDVDSMSAFMERFSKQEMKDDCGVYKRCDEFLQKLNETRSNLDRGVLERDEDSLDASIAEYLSFKIPQDQMENDKSYLEAIRVKEEIRQEKLLKGRTQEEFRVSLRQAIASRNAADISAAVVAFKEAEIPDTNDDLDAAQTALQDIEDERKEHQKRSFEQMVQACETRDQIALRSAIEDCTKYGVSTKDIESGQTLLPTLVKEDELLSELNVLVEEGDMQKISDALIVYKTPALQLTDKTGDVAKAEKVLENLQEKDRMRRTKGDVMWRLQAAMAVGDVAAMDGMIKALQSLAAAGEDIPEAFLIRAITELENARGQVNYRKRMEAIKSGISRAIDSKEIMQLEDMIDQMAILADDKDYTMTSDDTRVLDSSRVELNTLKNQFAIRNEIEQVKPDLTIPLIPGNAARLREAVDRMVDAKQESAEHVGLFTEEEDNLLKESLANVEDLEHKVGMTNQARNNLNAAVDQRVFIPLRTAIKEAHAAPFMERDELVEPIQLAKYLDPKIRKLAVKNAMRSRNIKDLENALSDLKEAGVEDDALEEKGRYMLEKLQRRAVRQQKMERKKEREDAKRKADIERLTSTLSSAMQSRDVDQLQLALETFEDSGYDDVDVPTFVEAEQLFDELKINIVREKLKRGIEERDIESLEHAVDETELGGYILDVQDEYKQAKELLYHLKELKSLREAISEMNRSLISELHKYPKPPVPVHQVMMATLVLLGETPKKMKNWQEVQALLGKLGQNAITRRVRTFEAGEISSQLANKVTGMLKGIKLEEVSEISKGAATFYAWTIAMVRESQYSTVSAELREQEDYDVLKEKPTPTEAWEF